MCFPATPPERIDALIQQYRAIYPARGHKLTRMYPGVAEALARWAGENPSPPPRAPPPPASCWNSSACSATSTTCRAPRFPCKPAPDVIRTRWRRSAAKPEECLMVGDSSADMEAGRRAGVKTCAVRYGYGKPEALARFEPDYWIDDLRNWLACRWSSQPSKFF